jgi:phosphoserine phosphatase
MEIPFAIESFLSTLDPSEHARVAVFDCDGTVIRGDIGEAMFYFQLERFLFRESPAVTLPDHPDREEIDHLYHSLVRFPPYIGSQDGRQIALTNLLVTRYFDQLAEGKTEKACSDIVRLFSGFHLAELHEIAADTLRYELSSPLEERLLGKYILPKGIRYIAEAKELLRMFRGYGFEVKVVSGSSQWSVEAVCAGDELRISRADIMGIDLQRDGLIVSAHPIGPIPVKEGKVAALRAKGLPPPAIVVSDSFYDMPLFEYSSGLKVLIQTGESAQEIFRNAGIGADDSWVIIERPTYS